MADVTGLLPSRRRVEALARALDGEPAPADVLALARLAGTLETLPTATETEPDPEFRARLRERLVAEARQAPAAQDGARPHRSGDGGSVRPLQRVAVRKRAVAVAAAAGLGLGVGGAGVASADALPGESLYGMKRATESLRLAVAGSDADRGRLLLSFAGRRTGELESLLGSPYGLGGPADVPVAGVAADEERLRETLDDWERSTRDGAALLLSAHEETGQVQPLTEVDAFAREQRRRLTALAPSLPPALRGDAREALALLDSLQQRTVGMLRESQDAAPDAAEPCADASCPATPPPSPSAATSPRPGDGDTAPPPTSGDEGGTPAGGSDGGGDGGGTVPGVDVPTSTPSPGSGLRDTLDRLGDTLGGTADGAGDTLNDTTDGVGDTLDGATGGGRLGGTLDDTTDGVGDTLDDTTSGVGGALNDTTDGLSGG